MPHSAEQDRRAPDYRHYLRAFDRARERYQDEPTGRNLAVLFAGEEVLYRELLKPGRFELGQQVMTPGAMEAMRQAGNLPPEFLLRHKHGDWGELDDEDRQANDFALLHGSRLLSSYFTRLDEKLWVITEWDRSVTTLLLPSEY